MKKVVLLFVQHPIRVKFSLIHPAYSVFQVNSLNRHHLKLLKMVVKLNLDHLFVHLIYSKQTIKFLLEHSLFLLSFQCKWQSIIVLYSIFLVSCVLFRYSFSLFCCGYACFFFVLLKGERERERCIFYSSGKCILKRKYL